MKVSVGGRHFDSLDALSRYLTQIVSPHVGSVKNHLDKDAWPIMAELFARWSAIRRAPATAPPIVDIHVCTSSLGPRKHKQCRIVYDAQDPSQPQELIVSFREAVASLRCRNKDKVVESDPLKRLTPYMWKSVYQQLAGFVAAHPMSEDERCPCYQCAHTIGPFASIVDHKPPNTFKALQKQWLEENKAELSSIMVVEPAIDALAASNTQLTYSSPRTPGDSTLAEPWLKSWRKFHEENAQLALQCYACHYSRK